MLLLETVIGSRLYGTNRPESDWDLLRVWDHCKSSQSIGYDESYDAVVDATNWSLSLFMRICDKGGHQALDAMFSPVASVDLLGHFRRAYRANPYKAQPRFESAAEFLRSKGTPKKIRLADMLDNRAEHMFRCGRYDPTRVVQ